MQKYTKVIFNWQGKWINETIIVRQYWTHILLTNSIQHISIPLVWYENEHHPDTDNPVRNISNNSDLLWRRRKLVYMTLHRHTDKIQIMLRFRQWLVDRHSLLHWVVHVSRILSALRSQPHWIEHVHGLYVLDSTG